MQLPTQIYVHMYLYDIQPLDAWDTYPLLSEWAHDPDRTCEETELAEHWMKREHFPCRHVPEDFRVLVDTCSSATGHDKADEQHVFMFVRNDTSYSKHFTLISSVPLWHLAAPVLGELLRPADDAFLTAAQAQRLAASAEPRV